MSNNPDTFAPLSVALDAMERGGYDGVGVGIFGDVCAIDIDHCVDADGAFTALAADIMKTMLAYTEKSPSGHGVRIMFKAGGFLYDKARYYINNQKAGLEVYIAGCTQKYVTITGDMIAACEIAERGAQLQQVLDKYMVRPDKKPTQYRPAAPAPVSLDDAGLIEKAMGGRNGAVFSALWAGDISGFPSHSEADIALCNALAWWCNGDVARVDRLFRQSGMMRDKWDRPQAGSTYGRITAENAVATCRGGYDPAQPRSKPARLRPPDYSDAGNSEVFCTQHKHDLIYTDALGWLWWNGKRWERDDHKAVSWALDLSAQMLTEARQENRDVLHRQAEAKAKYAETGENSEEVKAADEEAKKAKAYLAHAQMTRNAIRIKNMLELSKAALVVKAEILDAEPFDLNTPAGIVDLRSGAIRPHSRDSFCSQITAIAPSSKGGDMWESFLDTVTAGDGSIKGFLQLVAGMALIGKVFHEGIILAFGGGRNGKSTMFNALALVLGEYSGGIDVKTITTDRANKGASLATLRGKRLVVTGELEEHQRLSVATLKQLGSTDKLTVEEKFRAPETVTQTHTLVLFTNHLPRVGSTDGGTWRRLTVVPFNATIPAGKGIQNYADVLFDKAGGAILSWAIQGAVNFSKNRFSLDIPEAVAEATEAYRAREDWLTNFINERCVSEANARVSASELYATYREWAADTGDYVRRLNDFTAGMEAAGYQNIRPKNKSTWVGLRLDTSAAYGGRYAAIG